MNYKGILFFLGIASLLVAVFSIFNVLYSFYFDFTIDLKSYVITLLVSLISGSLMYYMGHKNKKNISLTDQIFFIILSFIFLPLLISIPYFFSVYNISFLNAYFESISGFTTTGFSIIENVKDVDEPLILWRSSSQWVGGLLFLLATIGTIGSKQIKIKPAYLISGGASGRNFYNNFNYNFVKISLIYFSLTIFVIFLYSLNNIRLLDSVNLAFTTISSGGFLPTDSLSNIIRNNLQELILSLTLLLPIFNFFLLFDLSTKQLELKNHQEDLHLFILIAFLTIISYFFISPGEGIVNVLLSIISSISTSGITTYTPSNDLSLLLILLTIVGGSLISTSSGIKYVRFYILLKISYQEIHKIAKPMNIFNKNLFNSETKITDDDSKIAFLVFISFVISIFILSSILTLDNLNFETAFKLSILTLTNTTTSSLYGLDGLSFVDLSNLTKISLIIFMIFGKIELIAFLFLIKKFIFKE